MILQRDGRIRFGHGHELPLGATLRGEQLHPALGDAAQPLLDELGLGHVVGDEHLGRRRHWLGVELAHEG